MGSLLLVQEPCIEKSLGLLLALESSWTGKKIEVPLAKKSHAFQKILYLHNYRLDFFNQVHSRKLSSYAESIDENSSFCSSHQSPLGPNFPRYAF